MIKTIYGDAEWTPLVEGGVMLSAAGKHVVAVSYQYGHYCCFIYLTTTLKFKWLTAVDGDMAKIEAAAIAVEHGLIDSIDWLAST